MKNALFALALTCFLCAEVPAVEVQENAGKQDTKEYKYTPVPPLFFVKQFSPDHYAAARAKEEETPDKEERRHREMLKVTADTFQANDSSAFAAKVAAGIALIAALIAWFQYCMFEQQLEIMKESNKTAAIAANAALVSAKVAERAITEFERPWIFVEGVHIVRREDEGAPRITNNYWVSFRFKNYGRVPGIVVNCIARLVDASAIPAVPDYITGQIPLRLGRHVGTEAPVETSQFGPPSGGPEIWAVYGRLTYTEIGGAEHHTGFIVQISPHMPAFTSVNNDAYDYYD